MVDLSGRRPIPTDALQSMQGALLHRGPDEGGLLLRPGVGLASRRLSIVGIADGRQPMANEDQTVFVVFNGELFDYPEVRRDLKGRGHVFRSHCDTELVPHLWEEHGEAMFERLRGQFALALWDDRQQRLILARDRFGICPLYWTLQDGWLLFASEVKGLLASGLVPARPDLRGLNQFFSFFALPGPLTCFEGIRLLLPGHYLHITLAASYHRGRAPLPARISEHVYWEIDFPCHGEEEPGRDLPRLVDEFEALLLQSVRRRLRADVPVVSYLSGGIDSSLVVALASRIRGEPVPTFTVRVTDPRFDESTHAALVARHVGNDPFVLPYGPAEALNTYPELIEATEAPVIDTSSASLVLLARAVHDRGYKVALSGEGADEWLAGYPWYKLHKLLSWLDVIPGMPLNQWARRAYLRLSGAPRFPWSYVRRLQQAVGGSNPWLDVYGLMSLSKLRFFSRPMLDLVAEHVPYADLELNRERMRAWHPLHRGLYLGARIMLPGLLLMAKGDRVAMHSSVETRYPFLDEDVFAFLARVHPRWKLRGFTEKYLLRRLAERWLPPAIAWRRKAMFRAPMDSFHAANMPPFVDQLLSPESLAKTGYFDVESVQHWRQTFRQLRGGSGQRLSVEMGLVGVVATQLWHHQFIDASLADLPAAVQRVGPLAA
jgi:asparagine synthase (glutamine-hydrolysing)